MAIKAPKPREEETVEETTPAGERYIDVERKVLSSIPDSFNIQAERSKTEPLIFDLHPIVQNFGITKELLNY